jgi:uncharacterized membrane protein (DUF485 family)
MMTPNSPGRGRDGHDAVDYLAVEESPDFRELKSRHRRFVLPVAALAFVWFLAYVLLATYASDLMATPVVGRVNLGLILGLAQFATTFAITMIYVSYANRRLDPLSEKLRVELAETEAGR